MLLELAITDFAIIDSVRIGFEPGFNVLTGETGAGKSILIDALGAVLGERVGADVVRTGARGTRVEATFDVGEAAQGSALFATLAELGVEPDDGLLILSREISAGGRSSARINGRAVTAGMLGRIGALLVDIHGQSDHLSLLRPAQHLQMLDRYAGLLVDSHELASDVHDLREVRAWIAEVVGNARERAQRIDLLRFQVAEIDEARLWSGEERELLAERAVLANAERLSQDANAAYALMSGEDVGYPGEQGMPAIAALSQASGHVADIAGVDASMSPLAERAKEFVYLLEDIAAEIRAYRDSIEANPARLEAVEERLDTIKALKRKYGATVEEIVAFGESARRELEGLTGDEADVESLREREATLLGEIGRRAQALTRARRDAGDRMARAVERAIAELNMGRARFAVSLAQEPAGDGIEIRDADGRVRQVAFDQTGIDRVEFLIAPNAGEALKPLGRIASGGEMARLMLALKSILSAADETPTLVFDEVDVGVGGRSGHVVGEKLWRLSDAHQVLVITHLPQIAAFADAHLRITKGQRGERTVSDVAPITGAARIDELAAMLDGQPVTNAARRNAQEMSERVAQWKSTAIRDQTETQADRSAPAGFPAAHV